MSEMTETTTITAEAVETWDGSWNLTTAEYTATVEKIAKINARAAKRGFTGRLSVEGTRTEIQRTVNGFPRTEVIYPTKITGEAPKLNGWTLLASLDWDANAGLIVNTVPGVEHVDREGLREGWCDHCTTKRYRSKIYLVADETGKQLQVGSTCIKDFLGWSGNVVFISTEQVEREVRDFLTGQLFDREALVLDVLAVAWAAIKVHGFVPTKSYDRLSTADAVRATLFGKSKADREIAAELAPFVESSKAAAEQVREFVLSEQFAGHSEYVENLKAVAAAEYASDRHIGLLASAPQAWAREQERSLVRARERAEILNEWVGKVKDRITIEVKVTMVRFCESQWGTTSIYKLLDREGHVYTWFASHRALGSDASEEFRSLTGTVKSHDEYQGTKQTVLTRCKVNQGG